MARLVEERMEAERQQRELELKKQNLRELENARKAQVEAEQRKIEEDLKQKLLEEEQEREAERQRILEVWHLIADSYYMWLNKH